MTFHLFTELLLHHPIASKYGTTLRLGAIHTSFGSVSLVRDTLRRLPRFAFDLMVISNVFDHIMIHGEKALEFDPNCPDPIVHARPRDRSGLLGDLLLDLGRHASSMFGRALLIQENRYSPLLPVCLPVKELKVIRTMMIQERVRPDVEEDSFRVPHGYCGYRYEYGMTREGFRPIPTPLAALGNKDNYFTEDRLENDFACL